MRDKKAVPGKGLSFFCGTYVYSVFTAGRDYVIIQTVEQLFN